MTIMNLSYPLSTDDSHKLTEKANYTKLLVITLNLQCKNIKCLWVQTHYKGLRTSMEM